VSLAIVVDGEIVTGEARIEALILALGGIIKASNGISPGWSLQCALPDGSRHVVEIVRRRDGPTTP
jgi:hypothetical protein